MPRNEASPKGPRARVWIACREETSARAHASARVAGLVVDWATSSFAFALDKLRQQRPHAIIVEYELDAQSLWSFLECPATTSPRPCIVVVGAPTRNEVFRLARVGVDAYVESFENTALADLRLGSGLRHDGLLVAARANTGHIGLKEAQKAVRMAMFQEAIQRSRGNRHAAARVLQVDRRYVLKMLKE